MRLVWIRLHGYKRFEAPAKLRVDGRLVALTGPNEAGKSSVLDALERLNTDGEPFPASERTRRVSIPDGQIVLEARYLLERDDLRAISSFVGGNDARWFVIQHAANGELFHRVEPALVRDLRPRHAAARALARLVSRFAKAERSGALSTDAREEDGEGDDPFTSRDLKQLTDAMLSNEENLAPQVLSKLERGTNALRGVESSLGTKSVTVIQAAEDLLAQERTHPHDEARRLLYERRPAMLTFGTAQRDLRSDYDLNNDVPSLSPTAALRNLARLAGLDLGALQAAVANEDWGLVDTLIDEANETLRERFKISWRQSDLVVRFRTDDTVLRILIETPYEPSSRIDERSDGMRAFIALLAYTAVEVGDAYPPILLIDEAETHLHYAAQADLVQVLTEQTAASQVIYTTHSASCLPEDLGTSVRLIAPLPGPDRSTIRNSFWDDTPGFTPLLQGMGMAASALAFIPTRFVVFAEGPTELVLLPALLREATERRSLDFQVAPGLALVNRDTASTLELEAARVQYVVDSDSGGKEIRRILKRAGVPETDILLLQDGTEDGFSIEDFVDGETYRLAVNDELRRSYGTAHEVPKGLLAEKGRVAALREWCGKRGITEPNKVQVAERIVEMRGIRPLVAAKRKRALKSIYEQLRTRLQVDKLARL